jgi:hypothetical protein
MRTVVHTGAKVSMSLDTDNRISRTGGAIDVLYAQSTLSLVQ